MKSIVLSLAVVAIVGIMTVEAHSQVRCPSTCDTSECPPSPLCKCGTYKDECACCVFCSLCPGRSCNLMVNDVCSEGYSCTYPQYDPSYLNANLGKCTRNGDGA